MLGRDKALAYATVKAALTSRVSPHSNWFCPVTVLPYIAATLAQNAAVSWVSCMDQLCPSAQVLGTQVGSLRAHWCWWAMLCHKVFGAVTCALCYPEGTETGVWECSTLYKLSLSCAAGSAVPLGAHRDCCL